MQKRPVKHICFSRRRARIFLMFSIFFSIRHMLAAKQSSSAILFASDSPATVQPYSGGAFFMTSLCFLYTFFIELSTPIDKIKSMRTIADIFALVDGEYINRKERKNLYFASGRT